MAELTALVESAGLTVRETRSSRGRVRLDSANDFVAVEVKSTPLATRMSETQDRSVQEEARALPLVGHTSWQRSPPRRRARCS